MTSRVVIVRSARTVTGGGGGCCSGDVRPFDEGGGACDRATHGVPVDAPGEAPVGAPVDSEAALYLALRSALPDDVEVHVVSPSNWMWLLPALVGDGRRRGWRGAELRRAVRAGLAVSSLVVDGAVLFSGSLPDPDTAVAAVRAELALA